MNKNIFSLFICIIVFVGCCINTTQTHAQTSLEQIDFSSINVDDLSDQQVRQFVTRAETTGMTQQELEAEALRRGMPHSEVLKLRERMANITTPADASRTTTSGERRITEQASVEERETFTEEAPTTDEITIFGMDLFRRENLSFEPSLNIPTPRNYQLGPGDELFVEIWGASEQTYTLTVSPEGQVRISNLGPIQVSGLTIEEASELIINRLSSIYSGLRSPQRNTFAQVTLGNVRSIKVTISGDAYLPGTFTLPSFATAFNALYVAGGPSRRGSLRNIRIIRENEEIAVLDLYDFLLNGKTTNNVRLRDEDLIFITPYVNRATITGEVLRPAIYELKEHETLDDLIRFAGGLTASAFKKRIQIERKTDSQIKMLNVENSLFSSFLIRPGDRMEVGRILNIFENRVSIRGAVFRQGDFAFTEGMKVTDLISLAEGLREDAFLNRAAVYRLRDNMEMEVIDLNLNLIMNDPQADIALKREDLVMISSVLDLQQQRNVRILGQVREPGSFDWVHGLSLGEVIRKAGGFNDAASLARVEIARRVIDPSATTRPENTTEIFSFTIDASLALDDEASAFTLEPFDMIFVRSSPGYQGQRLAQVRGEVNFPGSYAISRNTEYISDLIARAGGITDGAFLPGATLIRSKANNRAERLRRLQALETGDLEINSDESQTDEQYIGIDLERILQNPHSRHDLILMEGDIIEIPMQLQTVRMTGAVLHPTSVVYHTSRGVRGYVSRSGGFAENAKRSKVYVIHPNGSVNRTRNYVLFRSYPSVEPGSEIVVPQKPEREPRTLQETLAISSAITSLALVIVTLVNQL